MCGLKHALPCVQCWCARLSAGMAPATTKLWGLVQADDGTTPEALAEALHAAAAAAAAKPPPSGSQASSCSSEGSMEGTAFKGPSTSKAGALSEGGLPTVSSSSQAAPLQEGAITCLLASFLLSFSAGVGTGRAGAVRPAGGAATHAPQHHCAPMRCHFLASVCPNLHSCSLLICC